MPSVAGRLARGFSGRVRGYRRHGGELTFALEVKRRPIPLKPVGGFA